MVCLVCKDRFCYIVRPCVFLGRPLRFEPTLKPIFRRSLSSSRTLLVFGNENGSYITGEILMRTAIGRFHWRSGGVEADARGETVESADGYR